MSIKMYALVKELEGTAAVYQRIDANTRTLLKVRPFDRPYIQVTCRNKIDGKNRTIRLKLNSDTIFQDEQIKEGIPANEPFTDMERKAPEFTNAFCITDQEVVQKFLEYSPQFVDSPTDSPGITKMYYLVDKQKEIQTDNKLLRKQVKAGSKIMDMDADQAKRLMLLINGSFFIVPETLEERQNSLIQFVNEADEDAIDKILNDEVTKDQEIMILLGELINAGVVSFDEVPNQVTMKKDGKTVNLKMISSEMDAEQRKIYFIEYLNSENGALLLADLQKIAAGKMEAKKEVKKK